MEADEVKLLLDVNIQCHHVTEARVPDMIVANKVERKCNITDIAVPSDSRTNNKENKKVNKYQDLNEEVNKIWPMRIAIVASVILRVLDITFNGALLQKTTLLGTARILRNIPDY